MSDSSSSSSSSGSSSSDLIRFLQEAATKYATASPSDYILFLRLNMDKLEPKLKALPRRLANRIRIAIMCEAGPTKNADNDRSGSIKTTLLDEEELYILANLPSYLMQRIVETESIFEFFERAARKNIGKDRDNDANNNKNRANNMDYKSAAPRDRDQATGRQQEEEERRKTTRTTTTTGSATPPPSLADAKSGSRGGSGNGGGGGSNVGVGPKFINPAELHIRRIPPSPPDGGPTLFAPVIPPSPPYGGPTLFAPTIPDPHGDDDSAKSESVEFLGQTLDLTMGYSGNIKITVDVTYLSNWGITILKDELLGRGSYASVFAVKATTPQLYDGRPLAIKIGNIRPNEYALALEASKLGIGLPVYHSGILPVVRSDDSTMNNVVQYILMARAEMSLENAREHGLLKAWKIATINRMADQLARHFAVMREYGFRHNDCKPENVLLDVQGDNVTVYISDFTTAYLDRMTTLQVEDLRQYIGWLRAIPIPGEPDYQNRRNLFDMACMVYQLIKYGYGALLILPLIQYWLRMFNTYAYLRDYAEDPLLLTVSPKKYYEWFEDYRKELNRKWTNLELKRPKTRKPSPPFLFEKPSPPASVANLTPPFPIVRPLPPVPVEIPSPPFF
jgi:hypothetical protein